MVVLSVLAQAAGLIAAGRLDEAESLLQSLLRDGPPDAVVLIDLGVIALRRGQLERAREWLARSVAMAPRNPAAQSNLAAVLARLSDLPGAEQHASAALAIDASNDEALITLAECLAARGDFDAAERNYGLASTHAGWGVAGLVRFGRDFFGRAQEAGAHDALAPVQVLAEGDAAAATHVLFVACSPDYLQRYGGSLVESLDVNGGQGPLLHLHVVGSDPEVTARLGRLPGRYAGLNLSITVESPDLAAYDPAQRAAFFTGVRFLHVPELLRRHARPVITLDIDAIIEGPTQALADEARGADLALMLRQPQRIAWTNVLAGAAVFNPTAGAQSFARLVKGYIEASIAEGRLGWNLDQVALYCSLVMLRRFGDPPAVKDLNTAAEKTVYQLSPLRGDKETDPKYQEYFAEI